MRLLLSPTEVVYQSMYSCKLEDTFVFRNQLTYFFPCVEDDEYDEHGKKRFERLAGCGIRRTLPVLET